VPPFLLTTPRGRFRCHMTVAGSDFVAATCRRGRKTFVLMTIRISRRAETRSDRTRRLREHPFRRGVNPPSENDGFGWPQCDGLKWPHFALVGVVGLECA